MSSGPCLQTVQNVLCPTFSSCAYLADYAHTCIRTRGGIDSAGPDISRVGWSANWNVQISITATEVLWHVIAYTAQSIGA